MVQPPFDERSVTLGFDNPRLERTPSFTKAYDDMREFLEDQLATQDLRLEDASILDAVDNLSFGSLHDEDAEAHSPVRVVDNIYERLGSLPDMPDSEFIDNESANFLIGNEFDEPIGDRSGVILVGDQFNLSREFDLAMEQEEAHRRLNTFHDADLGDDPFNESSSILNIPYDEEPSIGGRQYQREHQTNPIFDMSQEEFQLPNDSFLMDQSFEHDKPSKEVNTVAININMDAIHPERMILDEPDDLIYGPHIDFDPSRPNFLDSSIDTFTRGFLQEPMAPFRPGLMESVYGRLSGGNLPAPLSPQRGI